MLTRFVLIVVTTITWIIPIGTQGYQPSLHKRHNDEAHKVKVDQDFASRFIVGRRQSTRESPIFYHENNLTPYSADTPPSKQDIDVILKKIEELTSLVKIVLVRSFDRDEKEQRKNRQTVLYKTDDPKTDEIVSGMWWLEHGRDIESNEKNSPDSEATEIIRARIPYEEDHISLVKKSRFENEEET